MGYKGQETPAEEAERINAYLSADAKTREEMRKAAEAQAGAIATHELVEMPGFGETAPDVVEE